MPTRENLEETQHRTEQYIDFYNNKRLHLGIQFMTPLAKCSQGLELN
ncbi:IS3 family transposase [Candidatus Saccharibacteria bacterium]|nr:IS3 family transposase [Candidatus Saccharibacteria bacterium]MBO4813114.1 IS3 family transposase [Candidatus Saccharibacteria bacterium]